MIRTWKATLWAACMVCPFLANSVRAAGNDYSIVYGQRIGPVSIGMTSAQVLAAMGAPNNSRSYQDGGMLAEWPDVSVVFDKSQSVLTITTGSPSYVTREGLHAGDTEFVLLAKHPNPSWHNVIAGILSKYCYPDGSEFDLTIQGSNSTITAIKVNGCNP